MEGWVEYRIEDFGVISTGTTPSTKRPEFYGGIYKFISPVDLDNGKYISTAHKFITEEGLNVSRTLPKNAILVGCIGNIGKIGMTNDNISAFNQQINAIVCNENFFPDFIYYLLTYNKPVLEKTAVKTTLPILNKGNFQKIKLSAPGLPEQRKIAYVLSTVQKAIEQQDKLIRATTELKKALMQKLFTEGTKGEKQKETEIGLVPESWEEVAIGDLGKCVTGTTPKTAIEEYWNIDEFDFIAPADIGKAKYVYESEKKMSEAGLRVSRILPQNSVTCVCIGSSIGKVGMTFKEQSATNQQINSIICNEKYNPFYTYFLLSFYAEHWRSHATFGPVPILNKGQFEIVKIYASSDLDEQTFIAESLNAFDLKVEFHEKKKRILTDLFKTLLHELMTGQRRVNGIEFTALKREYKFEEQPLSMAAEQ